MFTRIAIFFFVLASILPANAQFSGKLLGLSGGPPPPSGVTASRTQSLLNNIGIVTHMPNGGVYGPTNVIADMAYLGLKRIRELATPITSAYTTAAAAGIKFNLVTSGFGCGSTAASAMTSLLSSWDGLVAATPGSIVSIEGLNEINNFNPCYLNTQTTNATTAAGNATLHFAVTMPSVQKVATGGYGNQMVITDVTTPTAIPANTTVVSATGTTVVMSANAAGAGVGAADIIQFQAAGTYPNNNANGVAWQTDIYNGVHGDANLTGVSVLNMTGCCTPVGVAGTFDFNTMHGYPVFGTQVMNQFNSFFTNANVAGGKPMQITETGFSTQPIATDGVDRLTAARLQLNGIMDYFKNNLAATYIYELIDVACDPTTLINNFGLFDCSNNPKTGANALKNFVGILTDAGGTALTFTPGALTYSVSGLASVGGSPCGNAGGPTCGSFQVLLQKSNGNFYVVLWNEPNIWNEATLSQVTPTPLSITVNFGQTFTTVNVYDPVTGALPTNTFSGVSSVNLSLGADLLIIEATSISSVAAIGFPLGLP